jgi:hypothetical protein
MFAKTDRPVAHRRNTLAATFATAALVLVPVGAAVAAAGTPSASAHTTTAVAHSAHPAAIAAKPAAAPIAVTPKKAAPAPAAAPVQADAYKSVSVSDLESTGLDGSQQTFTPSASQWANAATITEVAKKRGMPPYAAVIAVAVAMQESSLKNLTSATNYDSLGLFQQRPSMGWGSPSQLTDPSYAANAFLSALARDVPGYAHTSLWQAAQTVQESGFPTAYAQWQEQAAKMVHAIRA